MKKFEQPKAEMLNFEAKDVITESGPNDNNAGEEDIV